jgi:hypothetical protein
MRKEPRISDPSVVKARLELREAQKEGDWGKVAEALGKLKEAHLFQIRRLR